MTDAEFAAKLRSIRFGTPRKPGVVITGDDAKRVEAVSDVDGSTGGWHDYHADGHVDAVALAQTIAVEPTTDREKIK